MIDLHLKFIHKLIVLLIITFIVPPIGFLFYEYKNIDNTVKDMYEIKKPVLKFVKKQLTLPCKTFKLQGTAYDIKVIKNGTIALVASGSMGIHIVNIKDQKNPYILSTFKVNKSGYDSTHIIILSKDENILYAKDGEGVFSVDITDLKNPKLLDQLPINNSNGGQTYISISEDEKKLYISGFHGLIVADISQKEVMKTIGVYYDGIYNGAVEVDENTLYLVDQYGIDILDTSNMNKLKLVGNYPTMAVPNKITLSKNKKRAYLSSGTTGVEILNMKNKLNPKPFGSFTTKGIARHISIQNDGKILYAYNSKNNLEIFDVSYAYDPKLIQTIKFEDKKTRVLNYILSPDKKNLYIAYGLSGLGIVEMPILE